jgi:hypothetical protein
MHAYIVGLRNNRMAESSTCEGESQIFYVSVIYLVFGNMYLSHAVSLINMSLSIGCAFVRECDFIRDHNFVCV